MAEAGFALADAAAILRQAGLLVDVLVADGGSWRSAGGADATPPPLAFRGACLDSRQVRPGELFVALPGERTDGRRHAGAALAAGAAAVLAGAWGGGGDDPLAQQPAPVHGVVLLAGDPGAALAALASAWRRRCDVLVVAVTGTNGKTTTKDLLAALLSAAGPVLATRGNLNNDLGVPFTLLGLRPEHRHAVIEMGASAQGDIARLAALAAADIGVITNAGEAHLARFGSLADIIAGKGELLDALTPAGAAVLNADSPGFDAWRRRARCRLLTHGENAGQHRWRWRAGDDPGRGLLHLDGAWWEVPLPGRHNGANLAAALLAARAAGLDDDAARTGLARFSPSPHRGHLERIGQLLVLDDCYNANPTSVANAAAALVALPGGGRAIAVLGMMAELGPDSARLHREAGAQVASLGVDLLVAVGPEAAPLVEGCRAAGGQGVCVQTRAEAAEWLAAHTVPGDRVLVKGSRAAGMEDVIEQYRRRAAAGGTS